MQKNWHNLICAWNRFGNKNSKNVRIKIQTKKKNARTNINIHWVAKSADHTKKNRKRINEAPSRKYFGVSRSRAFWPKQREERPPFTVKGLWQTTKENRENGNTCPIRPADLSNVWEVYFRPFSGRAWDEIVPPARAARSRSILLYFLDERGTFE